MRIRSGWSTIKALWVGGFFISALFVATATLQASAWVKFPDIKGEYNDNGDWAEIDSSSIVGSENKDINPESSGNFIISKRVDSFSPYISEAVLKGTIFPEVIVEFYHIEKEEIEENDKATYGGPRSTYLKYELKNVKVTSYKVSGSGHSEDVPVEDFSLNFEGVSITYINSDNIDETLKKRGSTITEDISLTIEYEKASPKLQEK